MEKFLVTVAKYIAEKHPHGLDAICLVFPNRRSSVFFKAYLQNEIRGAKIGPQITTINEFINSHSEKQKADKLKLIAILYQAFKKHSNTSESFDEFYFWGEVLLSDFDDIDKYLANAPALFRNVLDLKEIESHFHFLEETQKEVLRRFWGSLGKWEDFKSQEEFLKLWKILGLVYSTFRELLKNEGIAYDGMVYRDVAEKIRNKDFINLSSKKYYIIGLNALNECEKVLLKHLKNLRIGAFLWDYDKAYIEDLKNEAGLFMRENIIAFPPPDDFSPWIDGFNTGKNIKTISVASSQAQAQALPKVINTSNNSFDNTAIVLADESLLFPVLGAIPNEAGPINITMGYPVKNSSVSGFISLLVNLLKNKRVKEGGQTVFYYRFVFDILNHQLLGGIEQEKSRALQDNAKLKNQVYISPYELAFSEIHKLIFHPPDDTSGFSKYFKSILKYLFLYLKERKPGNKVLPEILTSVYQAIEKLSFTIAEVEKPGKQTISPPVYFSLLNQYLSRLSVSYEGEPLSGLQAMGILETRCLDFEDVIILGFNEDFWPRAAVSPSFIPHNLRFIFGLPSIDNQDAMYAYYFYRLLQRASNVTLVYNSVKEGVRTGEISRFGKQLIYDSVHKIQQENLEFKFGVNHVKPLEAPSSPEIVKSLVNKYKNEKPLSPSAINTYLACKYRFYLRYIAGLPEGDEIAEEVDSRLFGNIFHEAVEKLYSGAKGIITTEWLDKIIKEKVWVDNVISEAFAKEYFKTNSLEGIELDGSLKLSYEFIRSYILQLLKIDREITPFEIISLEKEYTIGQKVAINNSSQTITIGGIIDRLDMVSGIIRVIDYKTGNVKSMSVKSIEELFDRSLAAPRKEAFQALLYCYVLNKGYFHDRQIMPGVYCLRHFFKDKFSPSFKINGKQEIVLNNVLDEFEVNLDSILSELFSENNVFTQTEKIERCGYCPYKAICHRY